MRVLVCGGRYSEHATVWNWLESFAQQDAAEACGKPSNTRITHIIHGGAKGADAAAEDWARSELKCFNWRFQANWKKEGKRAGPIRNARMIAQGHPDVVIAFPGGAGTADMVRQAEAAGIPIVRPVVSAPSLSAGENGR